MTSNPPDYSLGSGSVPRDVAREVARVSARARGLVRHIHWLESTGSTNDVAARLAESGACEGHLIVAETQTAGRGRHGRKWFSPPGAGLYASLILRPASAMSDEKNPTALLTLAAGVAIAEAVRVVTGLPAQIKWPNDIVIGTRKLAGILAESAIQAGALQFIVLGFGVNLRTAAYPPELSARATSIEAETGRPADIALMLAEIIAALGDRYADLLAGKFDAILGAWRQRAAQVPGARVEWDSPRGVVCGVAEDIDLEGALLVRVGTRLERVTAGEVRWVG